MRLIKRVLYFIFSERIYFTIISSFFLGLYFSGLLRLSRKFRMHYFVKKLISEGDILIDIGANLGYYTRIFSSATGDKGVVWAVEPVPLYREILKRNTRKASNVLILPYALGDKEEVVNMGIPGTSKYRHGLTRILDSDENDKETGIEVEVKTPHSLFKNLERIDYIKCDIEGYEDRVIPGFKEIIERDRPVLQIEIEKNNRKLIDDFLMNYGYLSYSASGGDLRRLEKGEICPGDILYIHKDFNFEALHN